MANRILSDEFQQRWIPKVVPAFESDVLMHKIRILIQVRTQASYVTCIEEFHSMAKYRIFNPLLVRQIQSIEIEAYLRRKIGSESQKQNDPVNE